MRMKGHIFILLFICLMVFSCSQSEDEVIVNATAKPTVTFLPSIGMPTRATETTFETNDEISVFAVKGSTTLKSSGNYADNVCYRISNNSFTAVNNGIAIDEDGLAYYAIYPYSSQAGSKMTFSVKSDQSKHSNLTASDLCTAFASKTSSQQVSLKFSHKLSRVLIKLAGEGIASKNISMKLTGVQTQVSTDLNANTFVGSGAKTEIKMGLTSTNTYEAIIAPQSIAANSDFLILTVDGQENILHLESNTDFLSGRQKSYNVEIGSSGNVVIFGGDISPWDNDAPVSQLGRVTLNNSDALNFGVFACERVGGVVIMDIKMKNVSDVDLQNVKFVRGFYDWGNILRWQAHDNLDNSYDNVELSFDQSRFKGEFNVMQLLRGEVKEGSIRINDFDKSNKAQQVSVWFKVSADNYAFGNDYNQDQVSVVQFGSIPITDNRVLSDGIQSCDRLLKFEVKSCKRNNEGNLIIQYSITNNSDETLQNFQLHGVGTYTKCFDDLSNNYWWDLAFNAEEYHGDATTDIKAHSTVQGYILVHDFSENAKSVSCYMSCDASSRQLDDEWLRFITIPVQK